MRSRIAGTGSYLPSQVLTNHDLARRVDTSDAWIRTRTGIRERRIAAPAESTSDLALHAARAALDVAEQAKSLGPFAELEEKVLSNPLDHQARFDLAVALNAKGKRDDAVTHLIAIVKRDRKWNEDAARKQLVTFFEAWGATDPATLEGRKKLSSVLFS